MNVWTHSPEDLLGAMRAAGLRRGYVVTAPGGGALRASNVVLEPVAAALRQDARDYYGHQGLFLEIGGESGHLLGAFVHRTVRGQAAGGVRYWSYPTVEAFVRDGLRLARGMGHKCALAGLWWGGGKGVIARRPGVDHLDPALRQAVFQDYGRFISSLRGCYVTAEDVGTTPPDMAQVFTTTRHTTCIPPALGGSGNPSVLTATGVVVAMEAALAHLGAGDLAGKTIAMQGLGNVAQYMIGDLLERKVARVIGADIDPRAVEAVRARFPDAPLQLRVVEPGDASVLAEPCDVLAPNACGAVLNPSTIPEIRARVVCGAANNQLEDPARDGPLLQRRGVTYVPDFLANRMGIVNCANEQYGVFPGDPAIAAHLQRDTPWGIFQRTQEILRRAADAGSDPAAEAVRLADALGEEPHPVWGNRGQTIIDALVAEGWDRG